MANQLTKYMPIGSLVSTIKLITDDGWVCCDGNEYENINNIYGDLIKMGIGEFNEETNIYKAPDYQNMELVPKTRITRLWETQTLENYHYLDKEDIKNKKEENLLSDYRKTTDTWFTGIINYFIKNRVLFNDNKVEVFWFIKYKI